MAIERHRHSWGGWDWEKISFNDLKDKPQIPIIKQITRVWSLWVSTFTADIWCNTRLIRIQCGAISASWQEWSDCSVAIDQDGTWDKWKWLSKSAGTSNIIIETARIVFLSGTIVKLILLWTIVSATLFTFTAVESDKIDTSAVALSTNDTTLITHKTSPPHSFRRL